jgi:hypothetical protein
MVVGAMLLDPYGAAVESILLCRLEVKDGVVSGVGDEGVIGTHPLPCVGMEAGDDATLAK